jgi:hypothetical protein
MKEPTVKLMKQNLPPLPIGNGPSRLLTLPQRTLMTSTMMTASSVYTGYDPVSIEVLRNDPAIHRLLDMMETCRPGGSSEEDDYIRDWIEPLDPAEDGYGNRIVEVPTPEGHPRILWSTHTDTVHWHDGRQKVEVTGCMAWTSDGSCLGSDDTVGNWLAIEMIKAKVPGVYVFHREEESGGGGSMWLAKNMAKWIESFDCAIALDRADYRDVITYQAGGRCCSDAFAKSLAALLDGDFQPCDRGVFTDTANYVNLIGECTNLSVGYFRQHGPMEHTNLSFAYSMRDALLKADWSKLVFERKAGAEDEEDWWFEDKYGTRPLVQKSVAQGDYADVDAMEDFVNNFPWVVAEFLVAKGYTIDDLDEYEPGSDR